MTSRSIGSLVLLFAAASLGAQTPETGRPTPGNVETGNQETEHPEGGPTGQSEEAIEKINRRAKQMREQLGTGKSIKSHVKVQVRLNNGNRLEGVVKDGRLVEKVTGLRFEDAHAKDKGAGIRLWYSGGTRNYVFVPFAELQSYRVLQRLTQKQLAELEVELQMKETQRLEQRNQPARDDPAKAGDTPAGPEGETLPPGLPGQLDPRQAAAERAGARSGDGGSGAQDGEKAEGKTAPAKTATAKADSKTGAKTGSKTGAKTGTADADAAEKETQRQWFKLLQDYPPDAGWNKAKRDEISRRFNVIGARPSAHEQRFVDEFAEWEKACDHFGVETTGGGESEGSGSSRRRGRKK